MRHLKERQRVTTGYAVYSYIFTNRRRSVIHTCTRPRRPYQPQGHQLFKRSRRNMLIIWSIDPGSPSSKRLRDYAIVCIGLTMGFRASDIASLQFENINWKQRIIRLVQQKTGKAIMMPMPVKTGNILFRYLRDGRPKSSDKHVFIVNAK